MDHATYMEQRLRLEQSAGRRALVANKLEQFAGRIAMGSTNLSLLIDNHARRSIFILHLRIVKPENREIFTMEVDPDFPGPASELVATINLLWEPNRLWITAQPPEWPFP